MKNFKKRKNNSPEGGFLKNHAIAKKYKPDGLAHENQMPINWHEVKIILDATVVEKYLNNRMAGNKNSPSLREKMLIQKIPQLNQNVFSEKSKVMVKLEIPEDIRVDNDLSPEDSLVSDDVPVKQKDRILVPIREFTKPLREDPHSQDPDNFSVGVALKNEVIESDYGYEEVIIYQELKDKLLKSEVLSVGEEFKHEEFVPNYGNVDLINEENNEELIPKSSCLVLENVPMKQEDCIPVLDSLNNHTFHDKEFIEPLSEDFQCQDRDNFTVEAALKDEIIESKSCYEQTMIGQEFKDALKNEVIESTFSCEQVIIGQEFKDVLKNEELFIGKEFKHEESIPCYENVEPIYQETNEEKISKNTLPSRKRKKCQESIDQKNNEEIIKKSTRASRKRKKCLDCDDCDHGSSKRSRVPSQNKALSPKLLNNSKPRSGKSKTPPKPSRPKSSVRDKKRKTNQESLHTNSPKPKLRKHLVYHCDHCDYKGQRSHLINHLRNAHAYLFPNDPVRCSDCDMKFNSWKELKTHRPVCLLFLICKVCLVNVPSKHAMARHMKTVHPEIIRRKKGETIIDKVCLNSMSGAMKTLELTPFGQRYIEIKNQYSEMESELIKLYCPECDVTRDRIKGERAPRCDSCKNRLLFQCQKCKYSRKRVSFISQHLMSKNSGCSIFQNLPFMHHEESSKAAEQASSKKPELHDCEICDFKGATRTQLYEHVLSVHLNNGIIKNGYYTCSKCRVSFRVGDVRLKKHEELCGIAIRLPCRFCPMTCYQTQHLSYHIAAMHFDELDGRDINEFVQEALDFKRMVKEVNLVRFNDKMRNGEAETERDYYHDGIASMLQPVCIVCKTGGPQEGEHCLKCQASLSFVCLKCDELFSKYSAAWIHATRMCEKRSFTLTFGKTSKNPAKVGASTSSKKLLYCEHCSFKNASKSILSNHIKFTHLKSQVVPGLLSCPKCSRRFDNFNLFHEHKLQCRVSYMCHFCNISSSKLHMIETHVTAKHAHLIYPHCKDTLDEILQQVVASKKVYPTKTRSRYDKFGRLIKRKFSDNIKLASFSCPKCDESVQKNFRFVSDTRTCPKCNTVMRVHCKICNRVYARWESIVNHLQWTDCGNVKAQTCNLDHLYCRKQPLAKMKKGSVAKG